MKPGGDGLGGRLLKLDHRADFALPLLLLLFVATGVSLAAGTLRIPGLAVLTPAGFFAFLFGLESYVFTTLFAARSADPPRAMRVVEALVMAVAAKTAAALPATGSLAGALFERFDHAQTWAGFLLLAWAWRRGQQIADWSRMLHPDLAVPDEAGERAQFTDHVEAYAAISQMLLSQLALTVLLPGLVATAAGIPAAAGGWMAAGQIFSGGLAALSLLVAAQLRRRIVWMAERVALPPALFGIWTSQGVSLLLLPLVLALILPGLPRIPVERFLGRRTVPLGQAPTAPPAGDESGGGMGRLLEQLARQAGPGVDLSWLLTALRWTASAAVILIALLVLRRAAREWQDRADQSARGLGGVLTALAAWYAALLKALACWLATGIQQAAATSAAAVSDWAERSQVVSRLLPDWERLPSDPRLAVRHFYRRLERAARQQGFARLPGETAAEFAQRLAAAAPEDGGELRQLTVIYQQARYSEETVTPSQASAVAQAWRRIGRALRQRARK